MTKVVNFYAPPSSGKSSLAAACYVHMGYRGETVSLITEFIKDAANRGQYRPTILDQPWILGNQSQMIRNAICSGYSHVFSESDPLLCAWYAEWYSPGMLSKSMIDLCLEWEKEVTRQTGTQFYRFFIELPEIVYAERYKSEGRWESFEVVMKMQAHMKQWLAALCPENLFVIYETRPELVLKEIE